MKKTLLILGVVVAAVLVSGGIFMLGSGRMEEPVEEIVSSPSEDMLQLAEFYQKQGRYEETYPLLMTLLDMPLSEHLLRDVTFRLGSVFYQDHVENGVPCLDAAETYLFSAFSMEGDRDLQFKAGMLLMDVRAEKQKTDLFSDLFDRLQAMELDDEETVALWRKKFDYLFESEQPWEALQDALVVAENYPLTTPGWRSMLADVRLRTNEKLLRDPEWFESYAQGIDLSGRRKLRQNLYDEISRSLDRQMEDASRETKSSLVLRQGLVMAVMNDLDGAKLNLRRSMETYASPDLLLALELVNALVGESGDEVELQQLVTQLLHGRGYTGFGQDEKLKIVEQLSSLRRYADALKVIDVDLKMKARSPGMDVLLAQAVVLEARQSNFDAARGYMDELYTMGSSEIFGRTLQAIIDMQLNRNEYSLAEEWALRYIGGVPVDSSYARDILFALFDTSYWMNRPLLEKLIIGAAAVEGNPNDERVAPVILRMAGFIEELGLPTLAGTYYNRIGLLNFFQDGQENASSSRNIGELAMLGKARCLKKSEEWGRADHLFRDLCRRTASPLIRSEIAVRWAELSLQFGQRKEAERRFNLADPQLLSPELRARYQLGQARLRNEDLMQDGPAIEEALSLLERLPDEERAQATIDFFNETFDYLSENGNRRAMDRLIDLACQSEFVDQIPVQSYVLKTVFDDVKLETVAELEDELQNAVMPDKASILDLAQSVERLDELSQRVGLHSKRSGDNEQQ